MRVTNATKIKVRDFKAKVANSTMGQFSEVPVWQSVRGIWRQLYGAYYEAGVSVEWHDFTTSGEFNWTRSFHPGGLELCLNLSGHGLVQGTDSTATYLPMAAGFHSIARDSLRAFRRAQERHQFVTIELSIEFLKVHLAECDGALHPLVERFVQGVSNQSEVSELHRLTTAHQQLIAQFQNPPVFQGGRKLWFKAKVLELMSEFFFERTGEGELFCDRQKRIDRQRVDKAVAVLRELLVEPPSLHELGRRVGCSPFHLSRIFSKEMGMTIPQFIRRTRMERAAELLATGQCNVTEAALEVGYSSMSHFSQAFCQTMGCCPNLYPRKKAVMEHAARCPV